MDRKRITIVTGTGGHLGTGHYQRMLNLALNLNMSDNFSAQIYLKHNEYQPHKQFAALFTYAVSIDSDLIIRDMRDSTRDEILSLKMIAPVLAIDDSGEGAEYADHSINLLPIPSERSVHSAIDRSLFLYGFNFAVGIDSLRRREFRGRDIDVSVYAGYDPSDELVSSIKGSIPEGAVSVLLALGKASPLTGQFNPDGIDYAEVISRSRVVVTHFGLTMYEGNACGCSIAALNPTLYHSSLTKTVAEIFRIIYISEYDSFNPEQLRASIKHELDNFTDRKISPSDTMSEIITSTTNFMWYLKDILKFK